MKPTPQAIENAARNIYTATPRNRPYEQLSLAKKNALRAQATKVLTGDLGDTVLVPKEATEAMLKAAVLAIHSFAHSADRGFDQYNGPWSEEAMRVYSARLEVGYRAMLAATEDSNDQG